MKRSILWIAAALLAASWVSRKGTDVGKLIPVQLLQVYMEEERIVLETDTGDLGRGDTLEEALNDLKATVSGMIFLDTADYLLVTEETTASLSSLASILRPGTEVCIVHEPVDGEKAAEYLEAHAPKSPMLRIRAGTGKIPVLYWEEERFRLEGQ